MNKSSFELPLKSVVNQYGDGEDNGALAVITSRSTNNDIERIKDTYPLAKGLYINVGLDSARHDTSRVRSLSRSFDLDIKEVHIPEVAVSFIDSVGVMESYSESTLIQTIHGIAADYALYNGFRTIEILDNFEDSAIASILPQYYFALSRQLNTSSGKNQISINNGSLKDIASDSILDSSTKPEESQQLIVSMLSGGPDSSALLAELVRRYHRRAVVEAIFINFGQPYLAQELLSARHIANICRVRLNEISVAGISHAFVGKGEQGIGYPILRNLIHGMYGLASDYSRYKSASELHHANIKEDVVNLPWLTEFFQKLSEVTSIVSSSSTIVEVKSEYLSVSKAEVILRGSEMMGDSIAETFSCLTTGTVGKHCGKCRSCRNRRKAFLASQIEDSTVYEVEPEVGEVELFDPPLL